MVLCWNLEDASVVFLFGRNIGLDILVESKMSSGSFFCMGRHCVLDPCNIAFLVRSNRDEDVFFFEVFGKKV